MRIVTSGQIDPHFENKPRIVEILQIWGRAQHSKSTILDCRISDFGNASSRVWEGFDEVLERGTQSLYVDAVDAALEKIDTLQRYAIVDQFVNRAKRQRVLVKNPLLPSCDKKRRELQIEAIDAVEKILKRRKLL